MSKLVADVERRQVKANAGTVASLLEAWLADIDAERSVYTMGEHRRTIDKNILPTLGDVRLDRLSAERLDRFNRTLRARGLSASSVRRHHAIFSASLRRAVK